ncbi:hypothetical protein EV426DRAFT_356951 [Tirmania nivea]|nr:hypothetical protein EV426DRAFT_356951 [Tirmania nivea]
MDNLEAAMVTIVEKMATCEFYAQIYDEGFQVTLAMTSTTQALEDGLGAALKDLYAAVQAFLEKAKEYFDPEKNVRQKVINYFNPFSVTMQPLIQGILDKERIVEKYAAIATMKKIKEGSIRVQEVHNVMMQIKAELKHLTKLDEILMSQDIWEIFVKSQNHVAQAPPPPPLDSELQRLKDKYLAESQQTDIFRENLYVPAQGMATQHAPEEEYFDLWERLESFMAPESPQRVCLLLGSAGAGKSAFNHYIATRIWETYDKNTSSVTTPIPAREELEFVFILDGYDEIEKRDRNFYIDNRLEDWNAKTVITSRPEYLGSGYQNRFHPPGRPQLLQEYWLAPFSTKDITEYISKYVQITTANSPPEVPSRSVKDYEELVQRPELRALVSNPFLLKLVMTIQPSTSETEFKREVVSALP